MWFLQSDFSVNVWLQGNFEKISFIYFLNLFLLLFELFVEAVWGGDVHASTGPAGGCEPCDLGAGNWT